LERRGETNPNGVGSIRSLGFPPWAGSREEIVEHEPPHHLAYVLVAGAIPVRRYRADVVLGRADGGGTTIRWTGSFDPVIPGTAAMMEAALRRLIGSFARRLARHAGRVTT
jgi:hypothetical protein